MGIFDIVLLAFVVIGIAIGLHRGFFDQLLSWVQIVCLFLLPGWIGSALFYSKDGLSGIGKTFSGMLNFNLSDGVVTNFINAKFITEGGLATTANEWLSMTLGLLILQAIIFAVMLILMIVGLHFGGHYIKKYRDLRKGFRTVDTLTGAVMGVANAYIVFCLLLGLINVLPEPILKPIASMIREGSLSSAIYDGNFIGDCIAKPYILEGVTKIINLLFI
ncbi:MAG: CvpA family protein [Clostridia bacterium]